ncbi:hypothetical protein A2U01_0006996, partial [Trifolium medium]|nr:hypothetical protein [Trifolium medium]
MSASSSNPAQVPNQQNNVSSIIKKGEDLKPAGKFMQIDIKELVLLEDRPIDFENFKLNGFDFEPLFKAQGWKNYCNMMNGPVYEHFVRAFWIKSYVFDDEHCKEEEKMMLDTNPGLKGQTREQMGLEPHIEDEIRSNFGGVNFVIKKEHIATLLSLESKGAKLHSFGKNGIKSHRDYVTKEIMKDGVYEGDSEARMKDKYRVIYRMFLNSIIPRRGGTGTIAWNYKHGIYFLGQGRKIDLVDLIFQNLCNAMSASIKHKIPNVAYPRLLSELFLQSGIVEYLKPVFSELFRETHCKHLNAEILRKMNINKKAILPENEKERVQQFFLDDIYKETGLRLTLKDVPPAPIFNEPKRGKRKAKASEDDEKEIKKVAGGSSMVAEKKDAPKALNE